MNRPILLLCSLLVLPLTLRAYNHDDNNIYNASHKDTILLADPTIFLDDDGTYYLYGTSSDHGFKVYSSPDLVSWRGPVGAIGGYCLTSDTSFGTKGFWAPQVFKRNDTYYMAYTANEQIAIAVSRSPLGPFSQNVKAKIPANVKEIDPFVFVDDDGKTYIYHVRLINGNAIYVAQLNDPLTVMNESTVVKCVQAGVGWEDTANAVWTVVEGPTVIKIDGVYYMFYSANDFRNIDYAIGYATATSPFGPWTKSGNPIISRENIGHNGTGHGDLFKDKHGNWQYVFHTHNSNTRVTPRKTAIVQLRKTREGFEIVPQTFRYLVY